MFLARFAERSAGQRGCLRVGMKAVRKDLTLILPYLIKTELRDDRGASWQGSGQIGTIAARETANCWGNASRAGLIRTDDQGIMSPLL
jgi:hypothetical protein